MGGRRVFRRWSPLKLGLGTVFHRDLVGGHYQWGVRCRWEASLHAVKPWQLRGAPHFHVGASLGTEA